MAAEIMARVRREPLRAPVAASFALVAIAVAYVTSHQPTIAFGAAVAAIGISFAVSRPLVATAVLAATFFFDGYLNAGGGLLTPAKAIGALAITAWLLDWGVNRRKIVNVPQLTVALVFLLWVVVSSATATDEKAAIVHVVRYAMFIVLFFLVVQTVKGSIDRAEAVVDVAVIAGGVAGFLGLYAFLSGATDRASGPLSDANDYGFLLATIVPLALSRFINARRRSVRAAAFGSALLLFGAVLASFSRSALSGLAVAALWALLSRRVHWRALLAALAGLALAGFVAYQLQPQVVTNAFTRKQHIAETNIQSRFTAWQVAVAEWRGSPITGVGPGNFEQRYAEHELPPPEGAPTTHNAYLNILAELGLPGLVAFVAFLVSSWWGMRRRSPDHRTDQLMSALQAGFVVALVGAIFLTEQFYPPLWFFSALGVGLMQVPADG